MHYYQFNIGDYQTHTNHLTELEDLAYRRMIDWCYLHEKPLANDVDEIARLIRMRTHCDCIANVLREFFYLTNDGYMSERVSYELEQIYSKSDKARSSANKRWNKIKGLDKDANAMRTHSEGNATHNTLPNNTIPNNTLPNTKDIATKVADSAFEEFWQSYPKKVGKGQAQKTWDKLKIKVIDEILNSLKWQRVCEQWQKDGGQFIPNPSTYLSQQRWLDEQPMPTKVIAYETPYQKSMRERVEEISPNIARKVSRPINFNFVEDIQDVITDQSN